MTRGKQILKEAKRIIAEAHERGNNDPMVDLAITLSFTLGARWADKNPHWISVDKKLPPRWDTNPNVSVPVITFGTLDESSIPFVELQRYHFGDGKWQYAKATHWMPFQYPEEETNNRDKRQNHG